MKHDFAIAALAALVLIAPMGTNAALAKEKKQIEKTYTLDRTTTGSVERNGQATPCNPDDRNAGIVCRINRGQTGVIYPTVPNFMQSTF